MDSKSTDGRPKRLDTSFDDSAGADASLSIDACEKEIRLDPYQEACGELVALRRDNVAVRVVLSVGTLRYPVGSPEAGICLATLTDLIGERVAVLRTPSHTDPIVVNVSEPGE